jgi:pilus assembly protein Flp/PilA
MTTLLNALCHLAKRTVKKEEGATMVEYGLLVGLIACVCVTVLTTLGNDLAALFTAVASDITTATP